MMVNINPIEKSERVDSPLLMSAPRGEPASSPPWVFGFVILRAALEHAGHKKHTIRLDAATCVEKLSLFAATSAHLLLLYLPSICKKF